MQKPHTGQPVQGTLSTLLAVSLLAGNGYFAKGLATDTLSLTLIRSLIAALCIACLVMLAGRSVILGRTRDYGLMLAAGTLLGVHWLCFFYSMKIASVALGMTMLYTYPLMTLALQGLCFRQRSPALSWLMAPLVIVGVYLMGDTGSDSAGDNLQGIGFGLVSALCFAGRNLMHQHYLSHCAPHTTIFYQTVVISILIIGCSFVVPGSQVSFQHVDQEWLMWLILGTLFTALPHSLMAAGIRSLGASSVAMIGCVQPFVATVIAYFLLNELPTAQVLFGGLLVLIAACIELSQMHGSRD